MSKKKSNPVPHNPHLDESEVKRVYLTLKFTESEMAEIEAATELTHEARMNMCRTGVLRYVRDLLQHDVTRRNTNSTTNNLNDVDNDILSLHKQGMTPQEIAKSVGWSVSLVKARIRELAV